MSGIIPSAPPAPIGTPAAAAPAGPCALCGHPIGDALYRVGARMICANCAAQMERLPDVNRFAAGPWMLGALAGLGAAIASGVVWAAVVKATRYELGLIAVGVGVFVSWAVMRAAGGRRGPSIQFLTISLSILGIIIGKGLSASWAMWDVIRREVPAGSNEPIFRVLVFFLAPFVTFTAIDILWYALAILQAWRQPRAIRIQLQGPFASASSSLPMAPLQLDRVEPLTHPAPIPASPVSPPVRQQFSAMSAIVLTVVTMMLSAAVYSGRWGQTFAALAVVSILIHELGHVVACKYYGLKASAPIFIPYLGALILLREKPPNAKVEAIIGIAGPIAGTAAALAFYLRYLQTHDAMSLRVAEFGFFINLFNLFPFRPLDGGRVAIAVHPVIWFFSALAGVVGIYGAWRAGIDPVMLLVLAVAAAACVMVILRQRRGDYYRISDAASIAIGLAYTGLTGALAWLWLSVRNLPDLASL